MTHTIPATSPKAAPAMAFGQELIRALTARGIPRNEIARSLGIGRTALDHYRTGSVLPKTATARAIAAALDWPKLATIADERTGAALASIGAMCGACEPEGLCRDDACPLRPFSPLPVAAHAPGSPRTLAAIRAQGWTPQRRAEQVAANGRRWSRPGERERQAERSATMHAARTPEQRQVIAERARKAYPPEARSATSKRVHAARGSAGA